MASHADRHRVAAARRRTSSRRSCCGSTIGCRVSMRLTGRGRPDGAPRRGQAPARSDGAGQATGRSAGRGQLRRGAARALRARPAGRRLPSPAANYPWCRNIRQPWIVDKTSSACPFQTTPSSVSAPRQPAGYHPGRVDQGQPWRPRDTPPTGHHRHGGDQSSVRSPRSASAYSPRRFGRPSPTAASTCGALVQGFATAADDASFIAAIPRREDARDALWRGTAWCSGSCLSDR